jgi:hypothetical protein
LGNGFFGSPNDPPTAREGGDEVSKPKFNIGDEVFYVTSSCHYGVDKPCEMCFGKCKVTVILGNGEHVESECGYCQHGVDRSSGFSKTWEPNAKIRFGTIKGISDSSDGWRFTLGYDHVESHEIFTSREDAMPLMERRLVAEKERRLAWERDNFITATKKQIWSVGYHRARIDDHKRQMGWHEMRLCMIKEKESQ